jgi:hypothetical protein
MRHPAACNGSEQKCLQDTVVMLAQLGRCLVGNLLLFMHICWQDTKENRQSWGVLCHCLTPCGCQVILQKPVLAAQLLLRICTAAQQCCARALSKFRLLSDVQHSVALHL